MATIEYKQIDELPQKTSLKNTDMFLVAQKDATEIGYISYQTAWQDLSSSIVTDAQKQSLKLELIVNISELNNSSKAVAGNVAYQIYNALTAVQANYVSKNPTSSQTIAGNLSFSNTPEFPTPSINDGNNKGATVGLVKSYVDSQIATFPLFTAMFSKQDLGSRTFIFSDVYARSSTSTVDRTYTLIVKFKDTSLSSSKKAKFTLSNNGTDGTITTISGQQDMTYNKSKSINKSWWHAKCQFVLKANVDPNTVNWTIDNAAAAVDVSMALYYGAV